MDGRLSRVVAPTLSSSRRLELLQRNRAQRRKMLFESLENRNLLATLFWDPNGATTGVGGAGTWDIASAFWTTDSTGETGHQVWNNGANDTAVFAGTGGAVAINPSVAFINVGGLDFDVTGYTLSTTGTKILTFAAGSNVDVAAGAGATISGVIGPTNGFTKIGTGDLTLSGANTYTGVTTITDGTVIVTNNTGLGTTAGNTVISSGATLDVRATAVAEPVTVSGTGVGGNGALISTTTGTVSGTVGLTAASSIGGSGSLTLSGVVSGSGAPTKVGTGTLTLSGTNTYSAGTVISAGTVTASNNAALGTTNTTTVNAGATLDVRATIPENLNVQGTGVGGNGALISGTTGTVSGTVTMAAATSMGGTGTLTLSGVVSGAGIPLTKVGTGTLVLSGNNNTYTGPTTVSAGTLRFGRRSALYSANQANWTATNLIVASGATLGFNVGGTNDFTAADIQLLSGLGTATGGFQSGSFLGLDPTNAPGGVFSYANPITNPNGGANALGVASLGTGIVKLSGANTYTGVTQVRTSILQFENPSALYNGVTANWTPANIVVLTGQTLAVNVGGAGEFTAAELDVLKTVGSATGGFANGSFLGIDTTNAGGSFSYASPITNTNGGANALGLVKLGTGTLSLSGVSTYTGNTVLSGGTLAFQTDQTLAGGLVFGLRNGATVGGALDLSNANVTFGGNLLVRTNTPVSAGVTITPATGLTTTEGGATATFTVVLNRAPTANVTIPLSSSNSAEGTIVPTSLVFTPGNWNVPQTVTVTGIDDVAADGNVAYSIVTGAITSADTSYNAVDPADVTLTNLDNESAAIAVTASSGLITTEAGGTATFSIVLTQQPTADVTIPLSSSDTTEGTVSPASVTFTPTNWNVPQVVTVTGVGDILTDGDIAYSIVTGPATSADLAYDTLNAADAAVTNRDDDSVVGNSVTVGAGRTLTVNGGMTLGYDAGSGTGGTASNLTVSGPGTMSVNGTTIAVSVNQAVVNATYFSSAILDVSNLGAFNTNVTDLQIGRGSNTTGAGTLLLSNTANTLITTNLFVGDTGTNNGNGLSTLVLGTGTNVIRADAINIGRGKGSSPGMVRFASQAPGSPGTVTINNKAGSGAANIEIANNATTGTGSAAVGTLDLRGHVATVTAGTVRMGNLDMAAGTTNIGSTSATLLFDAGTFTANILNMAPKTNGGTGTSRATVEIGGGTFTVNTTWTMGSQSTAGASIATVTITGGTVVANTAILTGTGTTTATLTLDGGTLDLTNKTLGSATLIDVLEFESGMLQNVLQINNGAGLTKTTAGTLILAGTNAYTGPTVVNAGTLLVDGTTAAGSPVTVNSTGTLGGTGTINGTVNTAGTGVVDAGAAGAAGGSLLLTNTLTLAPTSTFSVDIGGLTVGDGPGFYDQVIATSGIDLGGPGGATLNVTNNAFNPAVGATFRIIDNQSGTPVTGTFSLAGDPLTDGEQFVASGTTYEINYDGGDGNDVTLAVITAAPNAAPTALALSPTTIAENAGPNATVGTFTTTDPDSGDTFTYTLVPGVGSTDNGLFNISGSTLRATNSLNFEAQQTYNVRVRSTDAGGETFENTFTITATDVLEIGITVTPISGLTTTEAGGTATFTIVLNSQPTDDVVIPLSSSDTSEGTISTPTVTFTTLNWNTPQTVTVTGVDDVLVDGPIVYSIVTGASTSLDSNYNALNADDVAVTNTDNDVATAGVTVTQTGGTTTVAEGGATDSISVVLNSQPTSDVTITIGGGSQVTSNPTTLTFTTANWNVPQNATVTAVNDATAEGDHTGTLTFAASSSDAAYNGITIGSVTVQITDPLVIYINEIFFNPPTPGTDPPNEYVELRGTPNSVIPNGTYFVGIEGDSGVPAGDVQNIFDLSGKVFGSNGLLVILQKANAYTPAAGSSVYVNSGTGAGFGSGAGSSIGHSGDSSATDIENSSATFMVITTSTAPTLTDDIDSDGNGAADGAVFAGWTVLDSVGVVDATTDFGYGAINFVNNPTAVVSGTRVNTTFVAGYVGRIGNSTGSTAADWVASDPAGTSPNYTLGAAGVTTPSSLANSPLNHIGAANPAPAATAGITITPTTGLITTEAGGAATFTIVLNTQPTADVTIALSSSDTTEGTVAPASVTFTAANWNVAQTITVTGVDDQLDDGNIAYSIVTAAATSTDANYNGVNATDVTASNTDNDTSGVTVAPTTGLTTTESGGTATFTIVLTSQPTADVTIPLSSDDTTEGTVAPSSVTFTPANWNIAQTVTVTGVNDASVDGNVAYNIITGLVESLDTTYLGLTVADVSVTNTDNDVPGITVNPTAGLTTTEAGGTATFTIVLNTQPTADVTIPISSSDSSEGSVAPTSVIFTTANWNAPQTITVTGADDLLDDGDISYTIVTGAATSTDATYNNVNATDVAVSNTDNDASGITVTPTAGLTTTEAGGTATFTIVLNSQPTADVTIALSSSDTTEGTVAPVSVTFTAGDWNVAQTVTVTGVDDVLTDGNIAYTITTAPASSADPTYTSLDAADVAVSNTDNEVVTPPGITVAPTNNLTTTEAGGTATFTIVLNSQPTADVTIPLTSSDTTEGTVAPASLTFTTLNWNVPQTVTVTGADDQLVDGSIGYTIVTGAANSTDVGYSSLNAADVSITNTDNDVVGITVTPVAGLTTTEAGGTATFTIVLDSQPSSTVTIPLTSSDPTEGSVSPSSVTFTPANWNQPQTVTVTGVDDAVVDGTVAYTIVTGAATSSDVAFNGFDAADVSVSNTDNDVVGITVTPTAGLTTTEAGGTATFTIVLTSQPTSTVTIPLSSSDTTEGNVSPSSVTFTPANWNSPQTVTLTGVDDTLDDGDVSYTIFTGPATSSDTNYNSVDAADVAATNTDNDAVGITVTPTTGLTTTEGGGTATFTIVLNSQPTADVVIAVSSSDTTEGNVAPTSLTFTAANWNTPQTVTVTGVDDATVDGNIAYTIVTAAATSSDPAYNNFNPADVALTNTDNDVVTPGGVIVTPTSGLSTTEAGGTATFTIALTTQPTANVTIPLSSSDTTEGTVSPASVTFTSANWNTPQTVTITGVDDALIDGSVAYTIVTGAATSTDPTYTGVNGADVSVTNADNDSPGITVTPTSGLTTTEAGGTATFTIVLNAQPTANVTIPLSSNDTSEGTVSPSSLTFTTANWNAPQTVTVTGVDDALLDGNVLYSIVTGGATSTDPNYSGLDAADVTVSNTDNEAAVPAGITVNPTSGLTTTEAGGIAAFTIVLNSQPTSNVTISLTSSDATEGSVSPSSVTFTPSMWNVPQTVIVAGVDDALVDGNVTYSIITAPAVSSDANYNGLNAADVTLTNADDDTAAPAGITVTPTAGLTTTEAGGTATFTIVLLSQPTANVTIPLTSGDTTEGNVSPGNVIFTPANWNVPQTVTVTGVDDAIVDGSVTYAILTGAAVSTDNNYNNLNAADVSVTNTDNDVVAPTPGLTITPTSGLTTTETGGTATFTVVLNTQPTANVVVPFTSSDTGEGTLSPSSLTFTPANWNVPQTVTVTGVNDFIADGDAAYSIVTGIVSSADPAYQGLNPQDLSVTNIDNGGSGGNTPPTISDVGNQTTNEDTSLSGIAFTVNDTETPAANLTVTATSSNTTLFPNGSLTLGGSGTSRTLNLSPAANQSGTATITLTVSDGVTTTSDTFTVTVNPVNDAPTLNAISNPASLPLNSGAQTINLSGISAGGGETQNLTVTATSSNPALIPNPTVTYTSPNSTGTLNFTPVAGQSGTATITVTVTDNGGTANGGVNTTTRTFTVTVNGSSTIPTTPGFIDIIPDPDVPGGRVLVINGTNNLDVISITRYGTNRTLVVVPLSGIVRTFDNSAFDRVVINALGGNDRVVIDPFFSKNATINGDAGDDIITSGAGNDVIHGGTGRDYIYSGRGNDYVYGDDGNDYLSGDDGNDVVLGGANDDFIWGGQGSDVLNGGAGFDQIFGLGGDDLVIGGNLAQANNQQSLQTIQSLWTANQPFNNRISSLAGEINSTTVTTDGRSDWIYGHDGREWIVDYALQDIVWDFNPNPNTGDRRN